MKRKWLHELPYLLIALYATKIGQAWRLAEGKDAAHKLLSLMDSLSASFASPLPSFELHDLCIGLLLGAGFRLFIFIKDSEKKKYRKGREYGSARWGTPEDIKPFIDPVFANNVILTQTERLTMSSRPKNPAYARNKKHWKNANRNTLLCGSIRNISWRRELYALSTLLITRFSHD